jgi:transcriptional regulator of acetoin/glycerol metabolism
VINKLLAIESDGQAYSVTPEVMNLFKRHAWPGNFRQLTNLLRTAMVMADEDHVVRLEHLPEDFLEDVKTADDAVTTDAVMSAQTAIKPGTAPARLEDVELLAIQRALDEHGGNVSAAARTLGVSRNTIYRKLHQ